MSPSNHFNRTGTIRWLTPIISMMERNPRITLAVMFGILALSITGVTIYSVTKKPYIREDNFVLKGDTSPSISQGIGELWRNGTAVYDAMRLEREISRLLEKVNPSDTDSLELIEVLQELKEIQQKLNPPKR